MAVFPIVADPVDDKKGDQLCVCLSHPSNRIKWIDQCAFDLGPVLTSTTSAKVGKTAILVATNFKFSVLERIVSPAVQRVYCTEVSPIRSMYHEHGEIRHVQHGRRRQRLTLPPPPPATRGTAVARGARHCGWHGAAFCARAVDRSVRGGTRGRKASVAPPRRARRRRGALERRAWPPPGGGGGAGRAGRPRHAMRRGVLPPVTR